MSQNNRNRYKQEWDNSVTPGDSFRPWKNTGVSDLSIGCYPLPMLLARVEKHRSKPPVERFFDWIDMNLKYIKYILRF